MTGPQGLGSLAPQKAVFQARPAYAGPAASAMQLGRQFAPKGIVKAPIGLHALAPHFASHMPSAAAHLFPNLRMKGTR